MESTRQKKIARLLEKDLGGMFQSELGELTQNGMITVTKVIISPDLSYAKVYLSPFLIQDTESFLSNVKDHTKQIRQALAKKVRHQLRIVPDLHFFLDNTQEETQRIHNLLGQLDIPPAGDDDKEED
jgi:ribosome-binding factor A